MWLQSGQSMQEKESYAACTAAGEVAVHSQGKPPMELNSSLHAT